ncbi:MAG: hypothetical protein OJF59_000195 [Cytophagales bacterium]|jgi:hypothetical protein|nr:MAG: hypothetical protein OJF59_000195 [Cytophagales bacterium]
MLKLSSQNINKKRVKHILTDAMQEVKFLSDVHEASVVDSL